MEIDNSQPFPNCPDYTGHAWEKALKQRDTDTGSWKSAWEQWSGKSHMGKDLRGPLFIHQIKISFAQLWFPKK